MGHIRLGRLPRTRQWREVVALIEGHAPDTAVLAASAVAAEKDLLGAARDPGFVEALRLLALIPQAAREPDFAGALRELGLAVPDAPLLPDLLVALGRRLDEHARLAGRSDMGELARRALIGTLSREIGRSLPGLLEAETGDLRHAAARHGQPEAFAGLARAFFGRLTGEALASWLDRTLSTHVGPGRRFSDAAARAAFDTALAQYAAEATRIIREFAGGWYGKTLWREGTIKTDRASGFAAIALRKIVAELQRKRDADA